VDRPFVFLVLATRRVTPRYRLPLACLVWVWATPPSAHARAYSWYS